MDFKTLLKYFVLSLLCRCGSAVAFSPMSYLPQDWIDGKVIFERKKKDHIEKKTGHFGCFCAVSHHLHLPSLKCRLGCTHLYSLKLVFVHRLSHTPLGNAFSLVSPAKF